MKINFLFSPETFSYDGNCIPIKKMESMDHIYLLFLLERSDCIMYKRLVVVQNLHIYCF